MAAEEIVIRLCIISVYCVLSDINNRKYVGNFHVAANLGNACCIHFCL